MVQLAPRSPHARAEAARIDDDAPGGGAMAARRPSEAAAAGC